jgi:hypothetical protein
MPVTPLWRYVMRVVPWRSIAISCSTIVDVSTPEARPDSARFEAMR